MILHVSKAFAKHFKCEVSKLKEPKTQTGNLDCWSAHYFEIEKEPLVLIMNDACFWTFIIPVDNLSSFDELLSVFLRKVEIVWERFGSAFDSNNLSLVIYPRTNRSFIGSMNDLVMQMRIEDDEAYFDGRKPDWEEAEDVFNTMPFGALKYQNPVDLLSKVLGNK